MRRGFKEEGAVFGLADRAFVYKHDDGFEIPRTGSSIQHLVEVTER